MSTVCILIIIILLPLYPIVTLPLQTGQSLRYLQTLEDGRKTVQYLNHHERGILNFLASTTIIRNNEIVEEAFDIQQDHLYALNRDESKRTKKRLVRMLMSIYLLCICIRFAYTHYMYPYVYVIELCQSDWSSSRTASGRIQLATTRSSG